jgi:hypothetical protein
MPVLKHPLVTTSFQNLSHQANPTPQLQHTAYHNLSAMSDEYNEAATEKYTENNMNRS